MEDPSSVVLTLTHPLVARAEHPEAEALLAECCPHGAVPGLVRGGVVALFLPAPRSTLRVFVALVGRGAGQRLAPLHGPLNSTFSGRGTRSEVAHVVEGCDTVATTRRVLHATRHLHRVQPRGGVPNLLFLRSQRLRNGAANESSNSEEESDEAVSDSAPWNGSAVVVDSSHCECCKDLDLSELHASPELVFHAVDIDPIVIRFPRGTDATTMSESDSFFSMSVRRVVFHPDSLYTNIGSSVFCFTNLTTVDFRGLKNMPSFGNHLFQGCKKLTAEESEPDYDMSTSSSGSSTKTDKTDADDHDAVESPTVASADGDEAEAAIIFHRPPANDPPKKKCVIQ